MADTDIMREIKQKKSKLEFEIDDKHLLTVKADANFEESYPMVFRNEIVHSAGKLLENGNKYGGRNYKGIRINMEVEYIE